MKLIREGRFGQPKTYKTGAVVSSYPKPMLVLEYDHGGLTVIKDPIEFLTAEQFLSNKEPFTGITAIDMAALNTNALTDSYVPRQDVQTFPTTVKIINALVKNCPYKTVVLDTVTGLSDCIYGHQSAVNASALADARKWAGNIGMKVKQVIDVLCLVKANVVVIFHSDTEKNELTSEVREMPMVYSKLREFLGAMFDQFFYSCIENKKPVIKTAPTGLIRGLGCRWPTGLPETCGPLFNDIYGKETDVLK